jgi:hypothetical protein
LLENKIVLWYYEKEFAEKQIAAMEVGTRGSIYVPVDLFAPPLE